MLASFQDAEPPEVLETELKLGERLAPRQEIGRLARLVLLLPGNHFFLNMLFLEDFFKIPDQC